MEGTNVQADKALNAQDLFAAAMRGERHAAAAGLIGKQTAEASGLNPQDSVDISAAGHELQQAAAAEE
ncbi:MAG: hypothetical protein MAG453_02048 [Calditrichaeota bacterium]|nr:hypothetical protein [Calditrichota bacterium]